MPEGFRGVPHVQKDPGHEEPEAGFTTSMVFLPEQIAGSAHEFHGFDMVSPDHRTATVVPVLEVGLGVTSNNPRVGQALSLVVPSGRPMILTSGPLSVNLRFAPPPGVFGHWLGNVRVHIFWSDGTKQERLVGIRVASRTLDPVPAVPMVSSEDFDTHKPDVRVSMSGAGDAGDKISDAYAPADEVKPRYVLALDGELRKLGAAAKLIVGLQEGGLNLAWSRANKFERVPPKPGR